MYNIVPHMLKNAREVQIHVTEVYFKDKIRQASILKYLFCTVLMYCGTSNNNMATCIVFSVLFPSNSEKNSKTFCLKVQQDYSRYKNRATQVHSLLSCQNRKPRLHLTTGILETKVNRINTQQYYDVSHTTS